MERCVLCGGRLDRGRCVDCGLDNTKNDRKYQLNVHNEKGMSLHEGDCEDALNKGARKSRKQRPIKGADAPWVRLQGSHSDSCKGGDRKPSAGAARPVNGNAASGASRQAQAARRPTALAKQRQSVGTVKKKKHGGLFVLLLLLLYFLLTVFGGMREEEEWLGDRDEGIRQGNLAPAQPVRQGNLAPAQPVRQTVGLAFGRAVPQEGNEKGTAAGLADTPADFGRHARFPGEEDLSETASAEEELQWQM